MMISFKKILFTLLFSFQALLGFTDVIVMNPEPNSEVSGEIEAYLLEPEDPLSIYTSYTDIEVCTDDDLSTEVFLIGGIGEYNIEEILLDLEIRKSRLEQSVSESEMFPDLTLGLKLTKFDVVSTGNDFEVRATATSKINIFDGFRRKYTVRGQSERIAALAAQLRNAKLLKDQRLSQYLIQYQNLGSEAVVEVEKKQKNKDWLCLTRFQRSSNDGINTQLF